MIFVTVGTHEQPFNRLIEYMDNLKRDGLINEDLIIQTGYSTYEPKYCEWRELFSYDEMKKNVVKARIVITHGGPSSFIMPLQYGKIPIVVPRQKIYNEHVNDHQLEFANAVYERNHSIIVIRDVNELKNTILNYEEIIDSMPKKMISNNIKFNNEFDNIISGIINKHGDK